jgi:hypothetical protein
MQEHDVEGNLQMLYACPAKRKCNTLLREENFRKL